MRFKVVRSALFGAALVLACASSLAQSRSDQAFLAKDSQGNLAEVELAKLALGKTHDPEVHAFAQRMIQDHETLARTMRPFLQKAGIQPPTSLDTKHQRLYDKLNGLVGREFDTEYVKAMDEDHHDDLKDFQSEFNSTSDMQLKTAVHHGEEVIAQHTKMIDSISEKMGMKPAGA